MNERDVKVIRGRNNEFALFLLSKNQPLLDLSGLIRVVIEVDGKTIDSSVVGSDYIWWTDTEEWRAGQTRPVVKFKLGTLDDGQGGLLLTPGVSVGTKIITFDVDNPAGIEWTRSLVVDVLA